jgi:hypothetical protein
MLCATATSVGLPARCQVGGSTVFRVTTDLLELSVTVSGYKFRLVKTFPGLGGGGDFPETINSKDVISA